MCKLLVNRGAIAVGTHSSEETRQELHLPRLQGKVPRLCVMGCGRWETWTKWLEVFFLTLKAVISSLDICIHVATDSFFCFIKLRKRDSPLCSFCNSADATSSWLISFDHVPLWMSFERRFLTFVLHVYSHFRAGFCYLDVSTHPSNFFLFHFQLQL